MPHEPYLSVILPAYNEVRVIGNSLQAMRAFLDNQDYTYEVIVAADGDDATPHVVQEIAVHWPQLRLTHELGRHGKGRALRRAVRLARGHFVGFLDADYKTPIDEITRVLPLLNQGYDLVIGSRAMSDSTVQRQQPWFRQIGSKIFAIGMHALIGLPHIRDTQCGFKFFSRATAQEIFARTRIDGYMCDVEILWLAERLGYVVQEIGITWRDDGDSRLELFRGNARNFSELLRIRFGRYDLGSQKVRTSVGLPPTLLEP